MSWLGVGVGLGPGATAGLRLGRGFRVRVEGPHLVHADGLGVATYLLTYLLTYGRTHLEAQVRVDPVAASGVDPHEVLGRYGLLLVEHRGRACWVGLGVGVVSKWY